MESIGVRELRQHASRWLARVEAGESFTITDRGRPVASLGPPLVSDWDRMMAAGEVTAATTDIRAVDPVEDGAAGPTLSELIAEDRDDPR